LGKIRGVTCPQNIGIWAKSVGLPVHKIIKIEQNQWRYLSTKYRNLSKISGVTCPQNKEI
jgi:hypothetical protein